MADRTEKLSVQRTLSATTVKAVVVEDGISVTYVVKTYEGQVAKATRTALAGCDRLLAEALDGATAK